MPPTKPKPLIVTKPLPTAKRPPQHRRDVKGELDHAREERLPRVSSMYIQGQTQAEIARVLGVSRTLIASDLGVIRTRWREAQIRDFDELRSEQLAKVDGVEAEYWAAWERSKAAATRKTSERRDGVDRASVTVEDQTGDPRYLQGVERCIERRCKLLGLDAPVRSEVSGPGGGPIVSETRGPLLTPEEAITRYGDVFRSVIENRDSDAAGGGAAFQSVDTPRADGQTS